jgi:7-cyano-7-deazaguanine synthase
MIGKEKVVVLWSGGLDSTVLVGKYLSEGKDVYPITINYGQRHKKEIEAVMRMGREFGLKSKILDLGKLEILKCQLTTNEGNVNNNFIVPNRNMILLSLAVAYAVSVRARTVGISATKTDSPVFPDCRREFLEAMNLACVLGNGNSVRLDFPFINMTKAEVIELGFRLGVPFEYTWTCYEGKERPCLQCLSCIERVKGFMEVGVKDPLLTDKEWKKAIEKVRVWRKKKIKIMSLTQN